MGRPEHPLDSAATEIGAFAAALRDLRIQAGRPTYRQMAKSTSFSPATLARAANGRHLPSLEVTVAYVRACGADDGPWRERWQNAARASSQAPIIIGDTVIATEDPAATADENLVPGPATVARWRTRRQWLWLGSASAVILVAALAAMIYSAGGATTPEAAQQALSSQTPSLLSFHDKQDPYEAGCGPDQKELERQPVMWPDGSQYGELVLFHSRRCGASWVYVYGPNSTNWEVHLVVRRPGDQVSAEAVSNVDIRPNSWSDALSARDGCVLVEVFIVKAGARSRTSTSSCYKIG